MAGVTLTGSTLAAGASVGKTSIASCGPTPGVAPARATRWVAEAPHNFLNFGLSPTPPRRSAPGRQGRRLKEPQEHNLFLLTIHPRARYLLSVQAGQSLRGLKRAWRVTSLRGGRLRPARPKGSQKLGPKRRPVSASLRLRYRSATLAVARGNSAGLATCQPAEYALLSGRATDLGARLGFSRALRDSFYFGSPPK